eukprot:g10884.t1
MWPPTAGDTREGVLAGGAASEGRKKKRKNKKKKRPSSDPSSPSPLGGEHDNNGDGGEGAPARRKPGEQPKESGGVSSVAGGTSKSLVAVTASTRSNSEDAGGKTAVGGAGIGGKRMETAGRDDAGAGMDDDDDDDEGVVIQRERPPTPPLTNGTDKKKNKKKKKKRKKKTTVDDKAPSPTATGQLDGGGRVGEEGTPQKDTRRKKKRRKSSQDADADDSEPPSSGIPFALPPQGGRVFPTPLKPSGRSRSASIESAAEFFSTDPSVKAHRPGDHRNDHNTPAAAAMGAAAGAKNIGGSPACVGNGGSARKRQRDEAAGGGEGARLGGAVKGRVPRKHQEQRKGLPIFAHKAGIIRAVKEHQTVVVVGETGSGKSTQIPQFLYEAGMTGGALSWGSGEKLGGTPSQPEQTPAAAANGGGKSRRRFSGQGNVFKKAKANGAKGGGLLIACTQPRRVAAVTVSKRVAAEVGCELGHVVGYTVRFDDRTSKSTRIKYMTDGVLLREAMSDPLLSAYSAIVLDEAHERSLDTDILFGLVRRLQPKRPELKVIVMSATLDVDLFRSFFRDSVSLHVPGRTHPVDVMYATEDQDDYLDACLLTCLQIHEDEKGDGDVLVFLPGQDDIEALSQLLRENLAKLRAEKSRELAAAAADAAAAAGEDEFRPRGGGDLHGSGDGLLRESMVCPVFAALPQEQQLEAFEPAPKGTRKFVLATNIAETSITINGIRFVVDSGKVKVRSFQASTGMEFLRSQDVSKAQATQRAGRAGREAPGVCYRLFREDSYLELGDAPTPEILRVNLAQVVLQLKVMGIEDPSTFDYVTAPSRAALLKALATLAMLGALDKTGRVTPDGKRMAALPLDPAFAHLLIRSTEPRFSCVKEVLTTVACLSAENLLFYPPKEEARREADDAHRAFAAYEGDLPTLLRVYGAFLKERKDPTWCRRNFVNGRSVARAVDVRQQLAKILRERLKIDPEESCGAEMSQYLRCLVSGLFTNVALRQPSTSGGGGRRCYRTVIGGREAQIHPSSSLWRRNPPAKCVVFTELLSTSRDFIKTVTAVDASWLRELVPQYFKPSGAVGGFS